jgi:hypothetical protein
MPLPPAGAIWVDHPITLDEARARFPHEEIEIIQLTRAGTTHYVVGHGIDTWEAYGKAYSEAYRVMGPIPLPSPVMMVKYGLRPNRNEL